MKMGLVLKQMNIISFEDEKITNNTATAEVCGSKIGNGLGGG